MAKIVDVHRKFWFNVLLFMIYTLSVSLCTATLSDRETLYNITTCDTGNVVIDCGTSAVIAIERVKLAYRAGICTEGVYDEADCIQDATESDRQLTLRECSGRSTCTFDLTVTRAFCTSGTNPVSYVHIKYYCISDSRIKSVCSTDTMTSSGQPLYLTNPEYPSKTSTNHDCSCSLEVESCSSDVNLFVLDLDLYDNGTHCTQTINFADDSSTALKTLACETFYDSSALTYTLGSNFMTVSYKAESSTDGYFFIGLAATDTSATVSITCQAQVASWCIDCGSLPTLIDGSLTLTGDSSYGSTATVQCNLGYDANTTSISCMEQGVWGSAECTIKDCGSLPTLIDGSLTLSGDSSYGSSATVQCNQGYDSNTTSISCMAQGVWGSAECTIKDCGNLPNIDNGSVVLVISGVTTYEAVAEVTCDVGYTASAINIYCLSSGNWQTATCEDDDDVDDHGSDVKQKTSLLWLLWLLLILPFLIIVAQVVAICVFYKKFWQENQHRRHIRLLCRLGCIPFFGLIFITVTLCKTRKDGLKDNSVDISRQSTIVPSKDNNHHEKPNGEICEIGNRKLPPLDSNTYKTKDSHKQP